MRCLLAGWLLAGCAEHAIIMKRCPCVCIRDVKAFQWNSQLKQRFRDNKAVITIAAATFNYGFEYLGNGPRLVITPLTDRIYVTATQVSIGARVRAHGILTHHCMR